LVAAALQRLFAERGEAAGYAQLAPLSPHAVARLAAGMKVRVATLLVAAEKLSIPLEGTILGDDAGATDHRIAGG
jgi:hypothetical protein